MEAYAKKLIAILRNLRMELGKFVENLNSEIEFLQERIDIDDVDDDLLLELIDDMMEDCNYWEKEFRDLYNEFSRLYDDIEG